MDKGIRPAVLNKFVELNELRRRGLEPFVGKKANTIFRRAVTDFLETEFGIPITAAATHYNYAFQEVKKLNAELVDGLGRPEDKNNGGRKKKVLGSMMPSSGSAYALGFVGPMQPAAPAEELQPADPVQTEFKVCKKSDGTLVAEGLTLEAAKAMCDKAAAAKKAKLYWV